MPFQRVATRKARSELRAIEEERALREAICAECRERGFTCTFFYRSVVIRTPMAHWKFDYHMPRKTLWHESTYRINAETGHPAARHKQFEDRKLSWREVIDYIDKHDQWKAKQKSYLKIHSVDLRKYAVNEGVPTALFLQFWMVIPVSAAIDGGHCIR